MTTGERIRNRRKEIGLSADILANRIGVSRSTIFRWENGHIENISVDRLVPVARALNTTVQYLMGWEDNMDIPSSDIDEKEKKAIEYFESLSEDKKIEALNYLKYLSDSSDIE